MTMDDNERAPDSLPNRIELLNPVLERYFTLAIGQATYVLIVVGPQRANGEADFHLATNLEPETAALALRTMADKLDTLSSPEAEAHHAH